MDAYLAMTTRQAPRSRFTSRAGGILCRSPSKPRPRSARRHIRLAGGVKSGTCPRRRTRSLPPRCPRRGCPNPQPCDRYLAHYGNTILLRCARHPDGQSAEGSCDAPQNAEREARREWRPGVFEFLARVRRAVFTLVAHEWRTGTPEGRSNLFEKPL